MQDVEKEIARLIHARDAGGEPERLALKYRAMRDDVFAFFRGACYLYFRRLAEGPAPPPAPPAWICGDLHLANFAALPDEHGAANYAVNDFDECGLGPVSYDIIRAASSIFVARKKLQVDKEQAKALLAVFIQHFAKALERPDAHILAPPAAAPPAAMAQANANMLSARAYLREGALKLRDDGKYALPATVAQQRAVRALLAGHAETAPDFPRLTILDVARRVSGLASLGRKRFSILAQGADSAPQLLDLKEARLSAAAPFGGQHQPAWDSAAARVVAVELRCDPALQGVLAAVGAARGAMILRQARPREARLDLGALGSGQASSAHIAALARAAARVSIRTAGWRGAAALEELTAFGARREWQAELATLAVNLAKQNKDDWQSYCVAYDGGAFEPPKQKA